MKVDLTSTAIRDLSSIDAWYADSGPGIEVTPEFWQRKDREHAAWQKNRERG